MRFLAAWLMVAALLLAPARATQAAPAHKAAHKTAAAAAVAKPAEVAPAPAPPPAPVYATTQDRALYETLCAQVMAAFDSSRGGFVGRDGAPVEGAIELALARGRDGDALALARARQTLHWMHALMDTVAGGYVSTLKDMDPRETRFEKLTSLNARRLEVLTQALAIERDPVLERDAQRVLEYFDRLLTDPRGGFYNGQLGSREFEPEANGIALQGWVRWAAAHDDARRRDLAWRTTDMLWNSCREADLGMVRRDIWGTIHDPSLLSDQVEMARGCLFLFSAAGRDSDGLRAAALVRHLRVHFEDERKGGFREEYAYERFGHAHRASRPADDNARAARLLIEYGVANADTSTIGSARRTLTSFVRDARPRLETAEWALALRALWAPRGDALPARARFAPAEAPTPPVAAKKRPAPGRKRR
jgi:uncharacterized protein YyaL (SSP411 family)